jgi:hypothetical protein
MNEVRVIPIDPTNFTLEDYSSSDENLISQQQVSTTFSQQTDYIEYFVYNPNNGGLVYPLTGASANFTGYSLLDNTLYINPEEDLRSRGFYNGSYNTLYNFLSNRLSSNFSRRYFISEISSDRTEIRLISNDISTPELIASTNDFIQERASDNFFPDFYLNFGQNQLVISNNIQLDVDSILIKLYEALPPQFSLNSTLWVVEQIADSVAYLVEIPNTPIIVDNSIKLRGPNLNIKVKGEVNNSTQNVDYLELTTTTSTSSLQQINSYYEDPSVKINVDYSEFNNFINFSSVEARLNNFFYKLQQIENWTTLASEGSGIAITTTSASSAVYQSKINEVITTFDNYEYYLYYTSASTAWPKTNTTQPYTQYSTISTEGQTWITSSLLSAELYDLDNSNWIFYALPEYLREDSANQPYLNFCNMVGQFYDENIWVYVKDITNKWDNDNRIDFGISPDLIAQQLRDLGFTIYENNFSSFNLFTSTLGITPSGSAFPYPYMTGSLPTPTGFEYVNNFVTGSNEILPQDDVNKRLYKRIYNNLSYLYKKKGTVDGIRALATIYGIPDTLLQINEFGSKDKDNTNDYDFWFNQFNYKYDTEDAGTITTDWTLNSEWFVQSDTPKTVEFRFKAPSLQSAIDTPQQALWVKETTAIVLNYTGSGYTSGSYGGSIPDPYNEYAHLIFTADNFATTASVYLPFFDSGWWSTAVTYDTVQETFTLSAANNIYSGVDGSQLGFNASSSISSTGNDWDNGGAGSIFPSTIDTYSRFSGSYQEIRYYTVPLNSQSFFDYTMNPQSIEGNGINSAPDQLAFRASLGGELYIESSSIHPKVTGSWVPIPSFGSDSNFTITDGSFTENNEYVYMDQPAVGIKNRVSDKIRNVSLNLPAGNQQLSNIVSIQQDNNTANGAYTDTVNLVEVSLSPTNQINDDIINSLGYFNIGEYIGDPRLNLTSSNTYPDLVALSNDYFLKYTGNYDWNDFVRLIKFFDNSLFKLIKDFVPAKVASATGITIKQHLLERNKYPEPQVSRSFHELTGSIGQIPYLLDDQRAYSASTDYQSFPIVVPSGSDGGTLPNFVLDTNYTDFVYPGAINVTQSWIGSNVTPFGYSPYTQSDAREFIDGEFSGSTLVVTTQSLNPGCDPFKTPDTTQILYNVVSLANNAGGTNLGTYPQRSFSFFLNPPATQFGTDGDIVLWWNAKFVGLGETLSFAWSYSVEAIKIFKESANGINSGNYLGELTNIIINTNTFTFLPTSDVLNTTTSTIECTVLSISEYPDFYLYYVTPTGVINFESNAGQPDGIGINEQTNILSVLTPYVPSTFFNSDCNAVINNALIPRQSEIFWELDYQSNAIQANNQQVIISASQQGTTLPKAFVQDYNWYSTPIKRRNFLGAKTEAPNFNLNATLGGFGQLPVVQSEGYYFAFFNWVGGTSPEWGNNLEDRSAVNIRYYIDENANIIEPINDSNGINLSIVQQNFEQDSNAILSFNDTQGTTAQFSNLEGLQPIFKSGQKIEPIIYTQTSSIGSNSTLANSGGGCAPSLDFVFGDLPPGTIAENYSMYSYNTGTVWQFGAVLFANNIQLGDEASWTSNYLYSPITVDPIDNNVTLYFEVQIDFSLDRYDFVSSCFFQKYIGGTWQNVGSNYQISLQGNTSGNFTCTYQDASAVAGDQYRFRVAYFNNTNLDPSDNQPIAPFIDSTSYFRVHQQPLSTAIPCTLFWENYPTPGTPSTQIKATDNNLPTTVGLKYFYGQRQENISGSGFNPITTEFTVRVGDEIRFEGTETQTYYIREVDTTGGEIILTLDRICTATNLAYFLLRRYVNDPSYILLSVDKPAGGTSTGILTPEYFYSNTQNNIQSTLATLKEKQLI